MYPSHFWVTSELRERCGLVNFTAHWHWQCRYSNPLFKATFRSSSSDYCFALNLFIKTSFHGFHVLQNFSLCDSKKAFVKNITDTVKILPGKNLVKGAKENLIFTYMSEESFTNGSSVLFFQIGWPLKRFLLFL